MQSIRWRRSNRGAVRELHCADWTPVASASRRRDWTWLTPPPDGSNLEELSKDPTQFHAPTVFEFDHQIAGFAAFRAGRLNEPLGRHPWSELEGAPRLASGSDPPCETLMLEVCGWCGPAAPQVRETWVTHGLVSTCQRLGAERLVVPAAVSADERSQLRRLSPASFLQQLHFRAIEATRLDVLLARGFELRGFYRRDRSEGPQIEIVLNWENPRV